MDKTFFNMSAKELDCLTIIERLRKGDINGTEAANLTGYTTRHIRRLKRKVDEDGPEALVHGNRGQESNRKIPKNEREKIIKLLKKHYYDFGPTFATEKLREDHGLKHDPKTIRNIMIEEKLWKPKRSKRKEHREWRQRKAHYGEMIQFDGSYHPWFEDRLTGKQCLLLAVDDATGQIVQAVFDEHEGVFPVFDFWLKYMKKHGKPMSIYLDRFSTYSMNQKLAQENPDTLTQFQRAARELRVEPILAHSPETKGRVERSFKTLQDRLVKEMRLAKINSLTQANQYLKDKFIPRYNERYTVTPRAKANFHKVLNTGEEKNIAGIFSKQKNRAVQNDFTISHEKQWYQLTKQQPITIQKKDKVIIEQYRDNSVKIRLRGRYLNFKPIAKGQKQIKRDIPWVIAATAPHQQKSDNLIKVGHF